MSPALVGRAELLAQLRGLVHAGTSVVLEGRRGVGRSAVLDELARTLEADPERVADGPAPRVLRAGGAAAGRDVELGTLRDLVAQLPGALSGDVAPDAPEDPQGGGRRLVELSQEAPVVVLLDDAHLADDASVTALADAVRRARGRVVVVAGVDAAVVGPAVDGLPGVRRTELPPLDSAATVELLAAHGVGPLAAHRLHVESAGVPAMALALGGAVSSRPALLGRPVDVPDEMTRVLESRLDELPAPVRSTLLRLALLSRPAVRQLERAGVADAEEHLRSATRAGLVRRDGNQVRLVPPPLSRLVVERVGATERSAAHRELADAATSPADRDRHLALADPRPDGARARDLADHARGAEERAPATAAELYVLAADRATADLATARTEWLVRAVECGAAGDAPEPVYTALEDFWDAVGATSAEQRVRVRLALLELAGTSVMAMEETLTAALADAGTHERLLAEVLLQRARVLMGSSRPVEAGLAAEEGVRMLRASGEGVEERAALAVALPVLAVARRWTGRGDHDGVLAEALSLAAPPQTGMVHTSPGYMAARFALYDDRLDPALGEFRMLLAQAERGPASDRIHLLRSLVEVAVRRGDCETAMHHAGQAAALAEEHDLAPYAVWFVSALAELAGGGLDHGLALATRGARAAEEERDNRYLQRHLILIGQARLRRGESRLAVEALRRVQTIEEGHGISDPTVNRWQPDLVSALLAMGEVDEAASVLAGARWALDGRTGTDGVAAQLDRVESELLTLRGETYDAVALLDRSEKVCRDLGMGIDVGRAMITRSHLERRRRRAAAGRDALVSAHAHFTDLRARPWVAQIEAEQEGTPGAGPAPGDGDDLLGSLTDAERGVALAVADGATNRETAERLWLSVKTVEAALTRVYRKLGVRSRTELAALVRERS